MSRRKRIALWSSALTVILLVAGAVGIAHNDTHVIAPEITASPYVTLKEPEPMITAAGDAVLSAEPKPVITTEAAPTSIPERSTVSTPDINYPSNPAKIPTYLTIPQTPYIPRPVVPIPAPQRPPVAPSVPLPQPVLPPTVVKPVEGLVEPLKPIIDPLLPPVLDPIIDPLLK